MLYMGMITEKEFGIMDDLMADLFRAGHVGLKASNPFGVRAPASGGGQLDLALAARSDLARTLASLNAKDHRLLSLVYELLYCSPQLENKTALARASIQVHELVLCLS